MEQLTQSLGVRSEQLVERVAERERELSAFKQAARKQQRGDAAHATQLLQRAQPIGSAQVVTEQVEVTDPKELLTLVDQLQGKLSDAAIVLGCSSDDDSVHLIASVAPSLVTRGLRADTVVRCAAQVAGGGGGGRETLARAGGRDAKKLPAALAAARAAIEQVLLSYCDAGILALDYGSAHCGCAISDPSGTLATPLQAVKQPTSKVGFAQLVQLVQAREVEAVVVGLPLTLAGEDSDQTRETRQFAARLTEQLMVPVTLYDERFTTKQAKSSGGGGQADEHSRAAAYLLESWLAWRSGAATAPAPHSPRRSTP